MSFVNSISWQNIELGTVHSMMPSELLEGFDQFVDQVAEVLTVQGSKLARKSATIENILLGQIASAIEK